MRSHEEQTWGGKKTTFSTWGEIVYPSTPFSLLWSGWVNHFILLKTGPKTGFEVITGQGSYAFGLNAFTSTGLYLLSGSVRLDVHWRSTFNLFCPARMLHCCNAVNSWVVGDIQRSCCHRRLNPWGSSNWRPGFQLTALKSVPWWNLGILVWIHWT